MNLRFVEDTQPQVELPNLVKSHEPLAGPLCELSERQGYCTHQSCMEIIADTPEYATCEKHGAVMVTEWGSGTGFAGGSVYWFSMSCGCTYMDESDDVEAAY